MTNYIVERRTIKDTITWNFSNYFEADIKYCEICQSSTRVQQFQSGMVEIVLTEEIDKMQTILKRLHIDSYNKNYKNDTAN